MDEAVDWGGEDADWVATDTHSRAFGHGKEVQGDSNGYG